MTLQEAIDFLGVTKPEIEKLIKSEKLTAYKLGGAFLRFKRDQLIHLKQTLQVKKEIQNEEAVLAKGSVKQFWFFNHFYIVAVIALSVLLYYLLKA